MSWTSWSRQCIPNRSRDQRVDPLARDRYGMHCRDQLVQLIGHQLEIRWAVERGVVPLAIPGLRVETLREIAGIGIADLAVERCNLRANPLHELWTARGITFDHDRVRGQCPADSNRNVRQRWVGQNQR